MEAPLRPSSELPMHLAIYGATGSGAVVHTPGVASTAVSTVLDELPASHYYTAMFGAPVRVSPYATFVRLLRRSPPPTLATGPA